MGPGAGLDRCGKYRPTGIRSPELPARSVSLYRLRYRGFPVLRRTEYVSPKFSREIKKKSFLFIFFPKKLILYYLR